jgi:hypothetical protein
MRTPGRHPRYARGTRTARPRHANGTSYAHHKTGASKAGAISPPDAAGKHGYRLVRAAISAGNWSAAGRMLVY